MRNDYVVIVLLFCYVFAFYIGPVSISILICFPLYFMSLYNKALKKEIIFVVKTKYLRNVIKIMTIVLGLSIFYPIICMTFDFSFSKSLLIQYIHVIAAIPFLAFIRYRKSSLQDIEKYFIWIYVVQSVIELIVLNNSYLSEAILSFNRYDPESGVGLGSSIRGKALSAATDYHLSLSYGIAFIIFMMNYISIKVNLKNIIIGLIIFVGIFFAGRTGFVGCIVGIIGTYLYPSTHKKIKSILKSIIIVVCIIAAINLLLFTFFNTFYEYAMTEIIPYAFEFLDTLGEGGKAETASTNRLKEMWGSDFSVFELLFGSGNYCNPDGSYYMHVDPGFLRSLLFFGVTGYALIIIFQFVLLPVWKMNGKRQYYYSMILIYLFLMDLKAVTISTNKFTFVICILLSFSYFYLPHSSFKFESK